MNLKQTLFLALLVAAIAVWRLIGDEAPVREDMPDVATVITQPETVDLAPLPEDFTAPQTHDTPTEQDNAILQCPEVSESDPDAINLVVSEHLQRLQDSPVESLRLSSILLEMSPRDVYPQRLRKLMEFNQQFPANPAALREIVRLCTLTRPNENCSPELIDAAAQADPDNGEMWMEIAAYHASTGNEQALKQAIGMMLGASHFSSDYADTLTRFLDTFVSEPQLSLRERLLYAIGMWAAKTITLGSVVRWCQANPDDTEIADLCFRFGGELQARNNLLITRLFGVSLQKIVATQQHDDAILAELEKQEERMNNWIPEGFNAAIDLMTHDPALMQEWLRNLAQFGEVRAAEMLTNEARRLSANPYYQPCPE